VNATSAAPLHIVYIVHGARKYHDQTRFSILTLLHLLLTQQRTDLRIHVYTDTPDALPVHPLVSSETLSPAQFRACRGRFDFIHRVKLVLIRRASRELGSALLYIDGDTRWRHLPQAVFDGLRRGDECCLCAREGELGPDFFPSYLAALRRHRQPLRAAGLPELERPVMWNSGAVGTPAGADAFYDTALALGDTLLTRVRPRLWLEQLAFSLTAHSRYPVVRTLDAAVDHYWTHGSEAPLYLREIFAGMDPDWSIERQAEYCANIRWDEERLRQIQADPAQRAMRRAARRRASLAKRLTDLRILLARLRGDPRCD
jgi:hypothetical protein